MNPSSVVHVAQIADDARRTIGYISGLYQVVFRYPSLELLKDIVLGFLFSSIYSADLCD